jgi:MFS family permease
VSTSTTTESAGIWATFKESPASVKALLAGVFVNKLGWFIQVFLVLFLTEVGFSDVQAGVALGFYGGGSVVGLLIGGALSDRLGPRNSVLVSMIGTAAFVIAVLYVTSYPLMLIVITLVGTVGQFYRPASAALLSEMTPANRQVMIFAMYRLALNLGTTAAPLIGAALLAVSWDLLFWGEAVAALAFAFIAAIALPKREPAAAAAEPGTKAAPVQKVGYGAVLADYRYVLFLLCMFINAAVYIQYLATLPLAIKAEGLSTWWFSACIALNGFIVITCELALTKVVQNWKARFVAMTGFVLLGGGLALYALPFVPAVFIIGTLVWTLAEIWAGPTMFAYPGMAGPEHLRGRYIGAAHAMFGLGTALGPIAGVIIFNRSGDLVWVLCGLVCLVGLAAAWFGMKERVVKDPEPELAGAEPVAAGS